jgi:hypothetical protein
MYGWMHGCRITSWRGKHAVRHESLCMQAQRRGVPEQITMSKGYPIPMTYRGLPSGSPAVHWETTLQ